MQESSIGRHARSHCNANLARLDQPLLAGRNPPLARIGEVGLRAKRERADANGYGSGYSDKCSGEPGWRYRTSVNGHSVASQLATASCTIRSSSAQFALTHDRTCATRESDPDG
jgi:hypothetical protein